MTQNHIIQRIKNVVHLSQSVVANIWYRFPQKQLKLIAVTGTDGKTTTTSLIYHILQNNGIKTAYLSTISAKIGDKELDTGLHVTTPDPWNIPKYLRMMVKAKTEIAIIEATSNGLQQNRLWSIDYEIATITNIGSDHLDYHGTWGHYAKAKFQLAKHIKKDGYIVLNYDHVKSRDWLKQQVKKLKFKLKVKWIKKDEIKNLIQTVDGISFKYKQIKFETSMIGEYNIENILTAIKVTKKYLSLKNIAKALKTFQPPLGRMEKVHSSPNIIIDFAHTPGALEAALKALNEVKTKRAKIITLFGCAGKRDKDRRKMGAVSAKYADVTILTAEDPRDESLREINNEIFEYSKSRGGVLIKRWINHSEYRSANIDKIKKEIDKTLYDQDKPFFAFDEENINSRKDAIDFAIKIADAKDIIFLTGKGHEQSLAFGSDERESAWTDQLAVKQLLN